MDCARHLCFCFKMKICSLCKLQLDVGAFNKSSSNDDGFQRYCRDCQKIKKRKWYSENIAHSIKYSKVWRKSNPEKFAAQARRHLLSVERRHPEKRSARTWVSNALRDGRLSKQPCWVCGEQKSEAHHVCYKDPSMISWLCRSHHAEAHELVRNA